jgi:hypothetical protein
MGRPDERSVVYFRYGTKYDEASDKMWSVPDLRKIILEIYVLRKFGEGNADPRKIAVMSNTDGMFDEVIPPKVYHPQWKKYMVRDIIRRWYPLAFKCGRTRRTRKGILVSMWLELCQSHACDIRRNILSDISNPPFQLSSKPTRRMQSGTSISMREVCPFDGSSPRSFPPLHFHSTPLPTGQLPPKRVEVVSDCIWLRFVCDPNHNPKEYKADDDKIGETQDRA